MNCALKVCQCFDVMVETHYETRIVSIMRVLYTCFVCVLQAKPFFYALLRSVSQILLANVNINKLSVIGPSFVFCFVLYMLASVYSRQILCQ